MPSYAYQAVDAGNRRVKGSINAPNLEEAESRLRLRSLFPISVRQRSESSFFSLSRKVSQRDVIGFTIQLRLMFTAGLPLLNSLKSIAEQTRNARFKEVVLDIAEKVETTGSFSESIAAHPRIFPPFYLGAVRAGESGGTLPEVLDELAKSLEKQEELQSGLKQALIYPIMIMVVMSLVTGLYAFYLMPKMMGLVQELGAPIPIYTRVVQWIVNTILGLWIPLVAFFIVGSVALFFYSRTESGAYVLSYVKLKVPMFGAVIQKSALCNFSYYM